jgi:hypothetical protein
MKIVAVETKDIDIVWPMIRDRVVKILATQVQKKALKQGQYVPEDTYAYLKSGDGLLVCVLDGDEITAFVTLVILNTDAGRSLCLSTMEGKDVSGWKIPLLDWMKAFAKRWNCNDIRVYTARKGWLRALKPLGFKNIGKLPMCGGLYSTMALSIGE